MLLFKPDSGVYRAGRRKIKQRAFGSVSGESRLAGERPTERPITEKVTNHSYKTFVLYQQRLDIHRNDFLFFGIGQRES